MTESILALHYSQPPNNTISPSLKSCYNPVLLSYFLQGPPGKRKYFTSPPPLTSDKIINCKNCICIPVALVHTCPLYHCIVFPPEGCVPLLEKCCYSLLKILTLLKTSGVLRKEGAISILQGVVAACLTAHGETFILEIS